MPEVSSGRQRLKHAARLIEHHLSDLQLLFDKDLLNTMGPEGSEYVDLSYLQEVLPALNDLTPAQLRRAIKYDAKDSLELHPELDMVRRCRPFSEIEAVDRMLFVDDIDIMGHESDPTHIFQQLLLPYPEAIPQQFNDEPGDENNLDQDQDQDQDQEQSEETMDHETTNQRTIIRPFGYKPSRFFQGFCYVEYPSKDISILMSSKILARNNTVRVMPM
ncbi:hypothetical protein B0O80DRAFT_429926 [Mortierella sp. GBAus27b]|nr:hypothetical protein BGX31_007770 [Mortierella sp. GBA43]KAI8347940.1 hypothetical protein B0O80DRAFT_429926 [Mortierella sp. GBAus27b]